MPSKTETLRRLFDAYRTGERQVAEEVLAENFTFTSPYDDAIDRAAYFKRCWPNADRIARHDLEVVVECPEGTFVLYRCVTTDGREFRNTEFFTFDGGRIASVQVFFGAEYHGGAFVPSK